jgi:alginate O-acetyltransferase complex protein AlgI
MLFNSPEFFVFFAITASVFFILGRFKPALTLYWLTACSFIFYGWWNPPYLLLIIGSIGLNYYLGRKLAESGNVWLLRFGVGLNLASIGYFKYANFFSDDGRITGS